MKQETLKPTPYILCEHREVIYWMLENIVDSCVARDCRYDHNDSDKIIRSISITKVPSRSVWLSLQLTGLPAFARSSTHCLENSEPCY